MKAYTMNPDQTVLKVGYRQFCYCNRVIVSALMLIARVEFFMLFCRLLIFFSKSNFSKNSFRNTV